jgi:NAD(P)H dehydrogenase (quinone)
VTAAPFDRGLGTATQVKKRASSEISLQAQSSVISHQPRFEEILMLRHAQSIEEKIMSKVLVLYYSSYGHIEAMANAVAEGARQAGAHVDIKRVPELVPEEVARKSHYKLDQAAPIAKVEDLAAYDAIVIGAGTRFGRLSSQMANFLDQAGGLWVRGALHGKVGGAFTSTATQHGGQEMTLFSIITNLLHFGMVVVGLDYGHAGQMTLDEITGGSPYGATTIAGGDGSRLPTANELQGHHDPSEVPGSIRSDGAGAAARAERDLEPATRSDHGRRSDRTSFKGQRHAQHPSLRTPDLGECSTRSDRPSGWFNERRARLFDRRAQA